MFILWIGELFMICNFLCHNHMSRRMTKMTCVPIEDSDQPGHPPSLHCVINGKLRTQGFFMRTVKTLIRLGTCPGWSVFVGYRSFCWFVMRWLIFCCSELLGRELSHVLRKPVLWGVRPDKTILLSYRSMPKSWNVKTYNVLCYLSSEQADLCLCYSYMAQTGFLMTWIK